MSKGAVVITESMLAIGMILIGLILLVITFNVIFSSQSANVEDTALIAISSELKVTLERVSAAASDVAKEYSFPSGISLNITISRKDLEITYVNNSRNIKTSFSSDLNTNRNYTFYNIRDICILSKDARISVVKGSCSCALLKSEPCIR